ncbi:MAG: hypothetical protein ACRD50_12710 [Candidatus Acidiferrales bacterium]
MNSASLCGARRILSGLPERPAWQSAQAPAAADAARPRADAS